MDTFFTPEVKFANDQGTVSGYGAVFGNVDHGFDRIASGAFSKSLRGKANLPMLFQHQPEQTVGIWNALAEDKRGLSVSGRISDTALGRDVRTLAKDGAVTGLSIGYRTVKDEFDDDGVRVITEADLWEVSLVTFPMNDMARVQSVKSQLRQGEVPAHRDLEFLLRRAGLSRRATKRLLEAGYAGFSKAEPEITELAGELRRLRTAFER